MKISLGIIIVLFLSFWTVRPLFNDGLFPVHDDTQVGRVIEMNNALKDGHFPVRWSKDLGYGFGYPLFNFYAPLPYYFGGLLLSFVNNPILAVKIMYAVGIIIAGVFMFLLVSEIFSPFLGLVSATLYMYAPYHAVQIYVRGAVGEYWAYGLLPGIIWGLYKIAKTKKILWVFISACLITLFILSHNIISMLFVLITLLVIIPILIICLIQRRKIETLKMIIISIILGLLMSAFFWIPAVFESQFTNVSSIISGGSVYSDHFVYLDQLWDSPWGFGGSAPGRLDGLSFKIGKIHLFAGLLGILIFYWLHFRKKVNQTMSIFSNILLIVLIFSVVMTLPISLFLWNIGSSFLKYVQFPWRLLIFILLSLSFFTGYIPLLLSRKRWKFIVGCIIIIICVVINNKYFQPQSYLNLRNKDYQNDVYLKWTVSKISDEYLPRDLIKPKEKESVVKNLIYKPTNLSYGIFNDKTAFLSFYLNSNYNQQIILNKTYFPGWIGFIDGKKVNIIKEQGLISFNIEKGYHEVVFLFGETPLRLLSNTLTILTMLGILLFCLKKNLLINNL